MAVTVALIQPLNKNFGSFSQIGMGFSIGIEAPAHPLMKHEIKIILVGEKSAKGSRKVGERRVCQDPTLAQNRLVCLAMPLQTPFKV